MNSLSPRFFFTALLACLVLSGTTLAIAAPLTADAPPPPDYGPERPDPIPTGPTNPSAGPNASVPEGPNAPEPEVTIVQRENATFEEYRINGRLYKIKVTPKIGAPYYLVDEEGSNVWHRYDSFDTGLQVPRWVILRF